MKTTDQRIEEIKEILSQDFNNIDEINNEIMQQGGNFTRLDNDKELWELLVYGSDGEKALLITININNLSITIK